MNAAASSCRTWMKRMWSWCVRKDSMIPLIPSPGRPKIVSTPQSMRRSIRTSAAVVDMAFGLRSVCTQGCEFCARLGRRTVGQLMQPADQVRCKAQQLSAMEGGQAAQEGAPGGRGDDQHA